MNSGLRTLPALACAASVLSCGLSLTAIAQKPLVNGKRIAEPPAGTLSRPLPGSPAYGLGKGSKITPNIGSHAANLVASPDGKYAVATDLGFREYLTSLDTSTGAIVSQIGYGAADVSGSFGLFYGLAFNPIQNADGTWTLYAAQGAYQTTEGNGPNRTYSEVIDVLKLSPATGALTRVSTLRINPITAAYKPDAQDDAANNVYKGTYTNNNPDFIAGLAVSADGKTLYAVNHQARTANAPGSLIIVDLTLPNPVQVGRFDFTRANGIARAVTVPETPEFGAGTASNFPYAVAVRGTTAYVASTQDNAVYALDVSKPDHPSLAAQIPVGVNPIGLTVNGTLLYVANAHSDTVSVVNTMTNGVTDIALRPNGAQSVPGVTPNQMTLSPDGKTLYAALSDFDAVAVIDTATNTVKGEIPVGWYPTAVVASPDGKRILVANARGSQSRYPNPGLQENTPRLNPSQYALNLIEATVQTLSVPTSAELARYTRQALANNGIGPRTDDPKNNPLFNISKAKGGITHVFYIIRENRTYDQVLGDLNTPAQGKRGNGDPSLTIFGSEVTPNIHALVKRFVLLDNFFDSGDASMEGWDWTTAALSSQHIARIQPYSYSGRGGNYDSEGTNNDYPVAGFPAGAFDQDNRPLPQLPAIHDLAVGPNGRIWDTLLAAGATVRNYGAMIAAGYPAVAGLQPGAHYDGGMGKFDPAKHGKTDLDFAPFNTGIAESPAPWSYAAQEPAPANLRFLPAARNRAYGQYTPKMTVGGNLTNAYNRFDEWNREFQAMLTNDPSGESVPNFEVIRFGRDHTAGINANGPSAKAMVADNDYAIGKLVETISKSPIWAHSAIFVLEDDAQNGPDHVDAHRSVGFVYSPYIKAGSYSGKFYSTNSVLHTMELLLNARPLTEYDAIANYIDAWDNAPRNIAPYTAIMPSHAVVTEVLTSGSLYSSAEKKEFDRLMRLQAKMDFTHADANDPGLLNEMIWKSVRGMKSRMPAPKNVLFSASALPKTTGRKQDGDD